ncbi:hypothetical protein NST86_33200 [Bacillus sp. FSL L8-0199]|uniref:hypothetical protein n=1 Tax=Bacillus sp. FSL L8-0199 TaxID=2954616 RepID=UPI0030F6B6F6
MVMKQISDCIDRALKGLPPLESKKWKAYLQWNEEHRTHYICLYHYQHLVLIYDTVKKSILHQWWEKPADKRGLDSAKEYIEEKERICLKEKKPLIQIGNK